MIEQRLQVWQALERCLNRIPVRDSLTVAGDFNTPLQPAPPFVGGVTSPLPCHPPEDMEDLAQLMRTYGLVALNTWRRHPPQAKATTFRFGNTESQIDFLLVRRREATMQAKQAHPIRHFHVGASRQNGAIHFPLITVLQLRCPHWVMRPAKSPPQISVDSVLQALDYPTVLDHMLRIAQVRQAISHHMATVGGVAGVEQLHAVLFQACCQAFPKPQTAPTEKPWLSQPVQLSVKELWARWRAFKQVRKNGLRGWFQAWRAWKNFDKQHREHQRRCKQARRAKLLTAMQEAQACAYKHDTRGLYQIVKRIAPKQAYRRLQLRDDRGLMLTPAEEADSLQMHFRTRFQAELPAPSNAETTQQQDAITGPWLLAAPPQLDAVALCLELQAIPRRKAVPAGHPPGAAWRLCADMVSTWICQELLHSWSTQPLAVPQSWSDVDLALILKPDKSGASPSDYRPIGLSCPLGKKMLSCILQPYIPHILAQITHFPQYAYQGGRSQNDALRKAFAHCAAARAELSRHHKNLHHQHEGRKSIPLFGSLMVTLDLSQAFDRVPRELLYQGMLDLQLPPDLIAIVMAWHAQIQYTVRHAGENRSFAATRGVRQGCSASPLLWLVFSHAISCRLAHIIGAAQLNKLLTIFADDYLAAGTFESLHELEQLLSCIAVLFKVLQSFGMAVSDAKSKAVFALRGTLSPSIRRKFIRKGNDGPLLRIPQLGGDLCIPLVSQVRYLGVQLNYTTFENATLHHRLDKGKAAFSRLGTILKGRHHLSSCQRINLWRACVWSTMAYGLTTCGLTAAGHKTLETLVIRQLRAILRLPAHLTQTTNQEVALQAGILLPSGTLSAMLQREAQRRAHCQDHHVALPTGAWWKHVHASLRPTPERDSLSLVASTAAPQVCPVCGVSYANRTALLTHLTKQHAAEYPTSRPEPFDKTLDAIGGLPQCSHCQKKFATWQLLQRHVEGNYCAVRHSFLPQPPADPVQPSMDGPPLFPESPIQDCISKYSSNAVYHLPDRHRYRQHCMLCGQWIASSKVMKLHYRQSHSDLTNSCEQSATRLCQSYTTGGTPCQYCGAHLVQPKAHKTVCPVLWQFCLNFACAQQTVHGNGGGAGRGHCSGDRVRQPGPELCPVLCRGSLGAEPDRVRASPQGCQGGAGKTGSAFRQLQLWWPQRPGTQGAGERRSQGPATNGGIGQGYGQAPHTPGDPTPDPQTELRLASLPATGDSWTDPGPIQGGGGLQGAGENQVYGGTGSGCPTAHPLPDTAALPSSPRQQCSSTEDGAEQGMDERGWQLELPKVGQRHTVAEGRRGQGPGTASGTGHFSRQAGRSGDRSRCDSSLQCDPPDIGGQGGPIAEVGLRAKGVEGTWNGLEMITNLAALQLVGMQIRREGLKREGLANEVQKLLHSF